MGLETSGTGGHASAPYQVVCYQCGHRGPVSATGPRDRGCPNCGFALITSTDMSPPAGLELALSRRSFLPGVQARPEGPLMESAHSSAALAVSGTTRASSFWSTAAICGLAVAAGIVARAMQLAF